MAVLAEQHLADEGFGAARGDRAGAAEGEAVGQVLREEGLAPSLGRGVLAGQGGAHGSRSARADRRLPCPFRLGGGEVRPSLSDRASYGPSDGGIARAAAQVVAQRLRDLGFGGIGDPVEEGLRRHDHAGRAETALDGALEDEGPLQRMELPARPGEAFDRLDLGAVHARGLEDAGAPGLPVDDDGAGAAVALLAAVLRADQAEFLAEEAEQGQRGIDIPDDSDAVHGEAEGD